MNIITSFKPKKIVSVVLGILLAGNLFAVAGAQTVTSTATSTAPSSTANAGFIEFNNLVVASVSSTSTPATIVAANTSTSDCVSYGASALNTEGRTIACPATSPYNLEVNSATQLYFRGRNSAPLTTFAVGDMVNVFGFYDPSTDTVQASLLRDLSKTEKSSGSNIADLTIGSAIDNAAPQVGSTVNYTLTVSASGPATSTGVAVTDTLPSGVTFVSATPSVGAYATSTGMWSVGTLASNATATLSIAAMVDASDTVGQTVTNTATVAEDASLTNNDSAQASSSAAFTVAGSTTTPTSTASSTVAGLTIMASADNLQPMPGANVNYMLTVSALGPATSTGVAATDILPSDLAFVSATSSVGSYNAITGAWSVGTLAPNATATLTIAATVNAYAPEGQTITDMATVGEDPTLTNPNAAQASSNVTVAVAAPAAASTTADISVAKTVDNAAPQVGGTVNYTVTATDLGPASSTGVSVNDLLPSGLTFVSATSSTGTYNSANGMWTIGELDPNATATLNVAAMVNASDAVGQIITNDASVNQSSDIIDPNAGNNSASVSLTVASTSVATSTAGLEIANVVNNASPEVGGTVDYALTVSALGPSASTNVVANDVLPVGLTFVSATPSVGTYNSTTGAWTIGTLAPNATATLNVAAMVNASDTVGQTITNVATVAEDPSLINPDNTEAIASAALGVSGVSGTPTSTPPMPTVPAMLSIDQNGNFLARGMVVTGVSSTFFQAQIWGITYTINWTDNDGNEFLFRNGNMPFNFGAYGDQFSDEIAVGDTVNVSGHLSQTTPLVVTANVVRDDTIISPRPHRPFQTENNYNFGGNGQFGYGATTNGDQSSSNGSTSAGFQTQLNGLASELQQLEQMFQNKFGH